MRSSDEPIQRNRPPARTREDREQEMISLAEDLAERQLREGTARSQVITHYLKLGSQRERIEREILEEQKKLVTAKTEAIQSQKRVEELYSKALNAMRRYAGGGDFDDADENI